MTSPSDGSPVSSWADLLPGDAPFDSEQRAWLNGFLVGLLGLPPGASDLDATSAPGAASPEVARAPEAPGAEPGGVLERFRVVSLRQLPVAGDGVDWRELTLDTGGSSSQFRPGDRLKILPQNPPDEVRSLLRAFGARGLEVVETARGERELWRCMLEEVALGRTARPTLELLAAAATAPSQRAHLQQLAEQESVGPSLLQLLEQHASARPSLHELLASLKPLVPREFFVASCQPKDRIRILVRPHTERVGKARRSGVASQYLCETVGVGDQLAVEHVSADEASWVDLEGPLTVLAHGTGIAWARGLAEEVASQRRHGDVWLILISTSPGEEQIYEADLERWQAQGVFSQLDRIGGGRKRTVTLRELLRRQARRLETRLRRPGRVHLCGEAGPWVEDFLELAVSAFQRHGPGPAGPSERLETLRAEGRLRTEVY